MEYFKDSQGNIVFVNASAPNGFAVSQETGKYVKLTDDFAPFTPSGTQRQRAEAISNQTAQTRVTASSRDGANTGRLSERTRVQAIKRSGQVVGYRIVGIKSGDVYGEVTATQGEGQAELIQKAYARQQQLQTGSTPTVSGRPDLYVIDPLPGEAQSTITAPNGEQVQPRAATAQELSARANNTLTSFNEAYSPQTTTDSGSTTGAGTGDAVAEEAITALEEAASTKEAEATAENPNLEITPEMRATWVAEARDELAQNRYYQELFQNAETDLGISFSRLAEDLRVAESAVQTQYKRNLETTQGNLQQSGFLYGGVRDRAERELAESTNTQLESINRQVGRSLQDVSREAERNLGTERFSSIANNLGSFNYAGRVIPGVPTFEAGSPGASLTVQGGQFGDIGRELELEVQTRAIEKENAFRDVTSIYG
jgi:flagellar motility protein MotE (MotC chaperone)